MLLLLAAVPGQARAGALDAGPSPTATPTTAPTPAATPGPSPTPLTLDGSPLVVHYTWYEGPASITGMAGAFRVIAAGPPDAGLHAAVSAQYFTEHGFIQPGYSHATTGSRLAIGYGYGESLEFAGSLLAAQSQDGSTNPHAINAIGDADLSARYSKLLLTHGLLVAVGAWGGVHFLQGTSPGADLATAASPYASGNLTVQTAAVRATLDAGFYLDRSRNVLPPHFAPDAGQAYAYGVDNYNAILAGASFDLPARDLSPIVELTLRDDLGAPGPPASLATAGLRWTTGGGRLSLAAVLDAGLSEKQVIAGRTRTPDYQFAGMMSYRFGGAIRPPPTAAAPLAEVPADSVLRGRILADDTGAPLPDCTVALEDGHSVKTDATGRFAFPPLPRGPAKLTLQHPQFDAAEKTAFLNAGQPTTLVVRLHRQPLVAPPADISAGPTAVVGGKITGKEGVPVRATISIQAGGKAVTVNSGPTGEYKAEVAAGEVELSVSAPGYATKTVKGVVAADQGLTLDVALARPKRK